MTVDVVSSSRQSVPMGTFRGVWPMGGAIVFFGFLSIGIPLPALSLQVHDILGCGPMAGLALARIGYSVPFLLGVIAPIPGLGFLGAVRRIKG